MMVKWSQAITCISCLFEYWNALGKAVFYNRNPMLSLAMLVLFLADGTRVKEACSQRIPIYVHSKFINNNPQPEVN